MNKNLYQKELRRNRKNLITWTAIIVGFTFMVMSIYPFMSEMGADMSMMLDKMPAELQKAMGMDANTWSNILGFYNTYYGIYIIVLISIFTASTAATIISKEEKDRTAEFLLTKPLSRKEIVITKLLSLWTLVAIVYTIQTLAAIIGILIWGEGVDWGNLVFMHAGGLVLIILFTCAGVLISMFLKPKKNFMGIVVGMTFGMYFINAIGKSTEATKWMSYISPFKYMEFDISSPDKSFNFIAASIMIVLGIGMLFTSLRTYQKKDIAT